MNPPRRAASSSLVGLPPLSRPDASALVVGSMPGAASLAAQQYYAHPRNAFWPVMGELFGAAPSLEYPARVARLLDARVAVWDVVRACRRDGSLDSAIERDSVEPNDFAAFVAAHRDLRLVVCNGGTARAFFLRYVLPHADDAVRCLSIVQAPSTSPAHASMTLRAKTAAWRAALRSVVECADT